MKNEDLIVDAKIALENGANILLTKDSEVVQLDSYGYYFFIGINDEVIPKAVSAPIEVLGQVVGNLLEQDFKLEIL